VGRVLVLVPDLLRQHPELADPADARRRAQALLQDEIQSGKVLAVVDVMVRAVVVEGDRAGEAGALERATEPALDGRRRVLRVGGRGRARQAAQQRDQDGERADQLSFSR
jgi:hypothetical protein